MFADKEFMKLGYRTKSVEYSIGDNGEVSADAITYLGSNGKILVKVDSGYVVGISMSGDDKEISFKELVAVHDLLDEMGLL